MVEKKNVFNLQRQKQIGGIFGVWQRAAFCKINKPSAERRGRSLPFVRLRPSTLSRLEKLCAESRLTEAAIVVIGCQ